MKSCIFAKWILLFALFAIGLSLQTTEKIAFAETAESKVSEIENEEFSQLLQEQINGLSLDNFDNFISSEGEFFFSDGFFSGVAKLLRGEYFSSEEDFFSSAISLFFVEFSSLLSYFACMLALVMLSGVLMAVSSDFLPAETRGVVSFAVLLMIATATVPIALEVVEDAKSAITSIYNQSQLAFPLLLTMVYALGGTASATCFSPSLYFLSNVILVVVEQVVFPMFLFVFGVNIISSMHKGVDFSGISKFCISTSKYILGIAFTIFSASMAVGGISAGSFDGISYRTAKYAISSSIPVIGSYIKDGFDLVLLSGMLLKNAVGVGFVLLAVFSILLPLLKLACLILVFRLVASLSSAFAPPEITKYFSGVASSLSLIASAYIAVIFCYSIGIIMLMLSSNMLI